MGKCLSKENINSFNCVFKWIEISTFLIIMEVFDIANKKQDLLINEQIKASTVLVIGPNGEQVGVKSLKDALTLSSYANLDLVLMNPNGNPPVCKVMDYNK